VLSMLLAARDEDGQPMTDRELRDELVTLLVAGHETTASALSWGFEQLLRAPEVLERVTGAAVEDDSAYLEATVKEILRRRPVLPIAQPRRIKQPVEIGGRAYPAGPAFTACIYLVQHDARIYPEPYAFRPERFLDTSPGTYAGSRSAAACAAASAPRSPSSRCGSRCGAARARAGARSRSARAAARRSRSARACVRRRFLSAPDPPRGCDHALRAPVGSSRRRSGARPERLRIRQQDGDHAASSEARRHAARGARPQAGRRA
jgi:hypothetical protein